ncbi:unnamed protein product [Blepharisma stoltei]|uniref:Uncharacterized protein n=1 Tax=Blepharisma stoltei TaxID=1481888 RepID=A0AAU9IL12_9CILI|nr:unnamed protein product [Blepharisma stoltei]
MESFAIVQKSIRAFFNRNRSKFESQLEQANPEIFEVETGFTKPDAEGYFTNVPIQDSSEIWTYFNLLNSICLNKWRRICMDLADIFSLLDMHDYCWIPLYLLIWNKNPKKVTDQVKQKIQRVADENALFRWCFSEENEDFVQTYTHGERRTYFLLFMYFVQFHNKEMESWKVSNQKVSWILEQFIQCIKSESILQSMDLTFFCSFIHKLADCYPNFPLPSCADWILINLRTREHLEFAFLVLFNKEVSEIEGIRYDLEDKIISFNLDISDNILSHYLLRYQNPDSFINGILKKYYLNKESMKERMKESMARILKFLSYYIKSVNPNDGLVLLQNIHPNILIEEEGILFEKPLKAIVNYQLTTPHKNKKFLSQYFKSIIPSSYSLAKWNIHLFLLYVYMNTKNRQKRELLAIQYIKQFIRNFYASINTRQLQVEMDALIQLCCDAIPNFRAELNEIIDEISQNPKVLHKYARVFLTSISIIDPETDEFTEGSSLVKDLFTIYNNFLDNPNIESLYIFESELTEFIDKKLGDFDYHRISFQECEDTTIMIKTLISIFKEEGLLKVKYKLHSLDINFYVNIQKTIIEEFMDSFAYISLFKSSTDTITKQYLVSHLRRLFDCSLDGTANENYVNEANQIAIKMIMTPPVCISESSLWDLMEIAKSPVVEEAFQALDLDENLYKFLEQSCENRIYFANVPDSISGITIFGGTILIHPKWSEDTPISQCGLKVVFLHELAHAVRKESTPGCYDISIKTPDSKGPFWKGPPGVPIELYKEKSEMLSEGGVLLETILFGTFLTKLSEDQINFLNYDANWNQPLDKFKDELSSKYHQYSAIYHLARGSNCSVNLDRIGHDRMQ